MIKDFYDYRKIPTILKRYSFQSKMAIAFSHSRFIMANNGMNLRSVSEGYPSPWELETFTMMAVIAKEWNNNSFSAPPDRCFSRIIQSIRDYIPPSIDDEKDQKSRLSRYLLAVGLVQFDIQKNVLPRLYRYWRIFNFKNENIDMPSLFQEKFNCVYDEFLEFALSLWLYFFSVNLPLTKQQVISISKKWPIPLQSLTITRSEYIQSLNNITPLIENYVFCLRPSYSFPFIQYNDITYLPLPYVLIRAVTASLLFRLTDQNNVLQQNIGKNVLESYLLDLVKEQDLDEVLEEKNYTSGHNTDQKTSDIMARRGNHVLFFDSKSFTPKRNNRTGDIDAIMSDIDRLALACVQMYKHLRNNFQTKYNFFEDRCNIPLSNRYGLVVVKEESPFMLEQIYLATAKHLSIDPESAEYRWLCLHIGVVEIDAVENYCFVHADILDSLIKRSNSDTIYDHCLVDDQSNHSVEYQPYSDFCDHLLDSVQEEMCEVFVDSLTQTDIEKLV